MHLSVGAEEDHGYPVRIISVPAEIRTGTSGSVRRDRQSRFLRRMVAIRPSRAVSMHLVVE
jgi:hypothetical protein